MSMHRDCRKPIDPFIGWLAGVAIGLAVLHGVLALLWGRGQFVAVLPWYVPMMHGFAVLAAFSIAFVAFGRYHALGMADAFWIGTAFNAFGILAVFYVLSWPGLLPDERGLIAQLPNTSGWLLGLKFGALAVFLLVAPFATWPRPGKTGEHRWLWPILAELGLMVAVAAVGGLSVAFEQFLPLLVVDGAWTPLFVGIFAVLLVAFAAGTTLSALRYRQTNDPLLGCVAFTQLALAFYVLTAIIGGERYDTWWYWQRILMVSGFSTLLFGLLAEYVGLYQRERERTRELEALQEQAQDERNHLRVLIDTAPIGIAFHAAPDGRLLLFNRAAEDILGRPLAPEVGVVGQPALYGIYRPSGEPFPPEELPASRSLRGETCVGVEMMIRQAVGPGVFILANSAPLRDAEGQISGAVVVFQDITPIKEQERLRDEFVSAAAHELKTPVTTIKGYVQLMRQWAPAGHEPREGEAFKVINAQCDRISRRVQEMLETLRFRTAPPSLERVRFDLGELASQVVRRMQTTTQLHRLLLESEAPAPVEADRERIEEVLVSLLDNAIRYSPKGGDIEVRISTQKREAIVTVRDHGAGIARDRQPHIFVPFYEAVPTGAPGYRGVVALSLYLSKLIVERHKGRIWFESEEGRGSTFYFSLPLAAPDT
ncbi:MAG: PAS domain-containing protein [Chloroflexota bacterium]|nr:MAG: PAS domain-containing protein [Chloroflexota bacterium]